jgi:hypothetical protein
MDAEAGEPGEHARAAAIALSCTPECPVMEGGISGRTGFGHGVSSCAEIFVAAFGITAVAFAPRPGLPTRR